MFDMIHCAATNELTADEIHRFNKAQQDGFLPHVESGLLRLVGATTENPSFELNAALLSRCRVIVLEKLGQATVVNLLRRAITLDTVFNQAPTHVEEEVFGFLAQTCDGDARAALNAFEMAARTASDDADGVKQITLQAVQEALQRSHYAYDKDGEHYYNMISALHKSIRGSDPDASLYWLTRMLVAGEVGCVCVSQNT
jgi:putative ATPase